jgi:hypothetical protein
MEYTLRCSSAADCLLIGVDGSWPSKPENIIEDIRNLWAKQPGQRLVLDIRSMEGPPSILGDFEDINHFIDAGFRKLGRVAILDNPDRQKDNDFFETAANNRGLSFRFFYGDEKDAINWLLPEGSDLV